MANELSTHYSPDISSVLQGTFSTLNYEQNGTEWPQLKVVKLLKHFKIDFFNLSILIVKIIMLAWRFTPKKSLLIKKSKQIRKYKTFKFLAFHPF